MSLELLWRVPEDPQVARDLPQLQAWNGGFQVFP